MLAPSYAADGGLDPSVMNFESTMPESFGANGASEIVSVPHTAVIANGIFNATGVRMIRRK